MKRAKTASSAFRAGCFECHGDDAYWTGSNAQAVAARHHDATRHRTWCDVVMMIRYGAIAADPRQIDIEDSIAAASSGGEPDAAPLPDPDAPTVAPADVSAPKAARSRRPAMRGGARGRKPETAHAP